MIKLGKYIQKNSKLILKNPAILLGAVLEEVFAGLLLQPLCALSHHGLLHLRHVVLWLHREKHTWNPGENSESAPTVTLTERAGRMRFETELGGVCVRLQVQTCTFMLTQNQHETSGRSFSLNWGLNYEARPGFLSLIWLHWSWHRQWPIRVSEALMLVRHQTTYLTWPGNTWGREKRLLTLLLSNTEIWLVSRRWSLMSNITFACWEVNHLHDTETSGLSWS